MRMLQSTLAIMGLALSSFAQADFIGVTGDISYWSVDGTTDTELNLLSNHEDDDLLLDPYAGFSNHYHIDRKGAVQASLAFEHPIPFVPNVKLKYSKLDLDAQANSIPLNQTKINLEHTDFILYYEILDNIVSADIGLGVLKLDGHVRHYDDLVYVSSEIDGYNPLIYAQAGGKLPFTGLSAKGEVVYSDFDDVKISDVQAEIQYNFIQNLLVDIGAKAGYRILNIELDKHNDHLKMEFKGPYIGLEAHF